MSGIFAGLVALQFLLAAATVAGLVFTTAPYGRHGRAGWGPTVPARVGWILMEAVSPLVFAVVFLAGANRADVVPLIFLAMWQAHYLQRAFVYPLLMRGRGRMPVLIALLAAAFNLLNAYINARWVSDLGVYPTAWLRDPRFLAGLALFCGGYAMNRAADRTLRKLRAPGETAYRIPSGGMFRWVSCPNYLGEIVQWFGWARSRPGPGRASRSPRTRLRTSCLVRWRTTAGTTRPSPTTRRTAVRSFRTCCERGGSRPETRRTQQSEVDGRPSLLSRALVALRRL